MRYNGFMKQVAKIVAQPIHVRRAGDIAGLIKARREVLGLSQQALADRLTVSRKWVNEIEQGHSNAKVGLVLRALTELGIDVFATTTAAPAAGSKADFVDDVDIDDIANLGLPTKRAGR